MKSSHYLAIALRVFAIFLVFYGLQQSSTLMEVFGTGGINGITVSILFALSTTICPILMALVLWFFPATVTNLILTPAMDKPVEPIQVKEVLTVLVLGISLFSLYNAIIDSVYWATWWKMASNSEYMVGTSLSLDSETRANMVTTALEVVVSLFLLFKARTVASVILLVAK